MCAYFTHTHMAYNLQPLGHMILHPPIIRNVINEPSVVFQNNHPVGYQWYVRINICIYLKIDTSECNNILSMIIVVISSIYRRTTSTWIILYRPFAIWMTIFLNLAVDYAVMITYVFFFKLHRTIVTRYYKKLHVNGEVTFGDISAPCYIIKAEVSITLAILR